MRDVDGQEADFSEANLQNANLKRADIMNANLSGTDISGANLEDVSILETDIKGAKLQVADFIQFSELLPLEIQESTEIPPESESSSSDGRWKELRVLLLSALYKERDSLLSLLQKYDNIEQDSGSYNSMIFEGNNGGEFIVKAVGDTGNAVIRESATNLIEEYNPHLVILYGIAAGFKSRVEKGDILVADKIVDLRKYKIENGYSFEPNIVDSPGSREYPFKIKSIINSIDAPEILPELHTDMIIGSSDTLSRDEDFMEAAKDIHRKMGALEMEGAGVAEVCRKTDTDFFIVKSISDYGGADKDDSLHGVCCDLAAETVLRGFLTDASL